MTCFYLIYGLFFIGIGFAVKAVPDLIAGYNTMTKEQKEQVDIKGLSTHLRNSLVGMGLLIIICYYTFTWLGLHEATEILIPSVVFGGFIYIFVYISPQINRAEKNKSYFYNCYGKEEKFYIENQG